MYKSRQKILLVTGTSVVVLAAFGVGSWAIIDSSNRIPVDNRVKSELSGATAYLNDTSFVYKQMSINDWMFYNFAKFAVPSTEADANGFTSIDFYSSLTLNANKITEDTLKKDQQKLLFTVKVKEATNEFQVWTSRFQDTNNHTGIMLVSSKSDVSASSITVNNQYYWSTNTETITFNSSDANTFGGSSAIDSKFTASYKKETNGTDQKASYTTDVTSNTDVNLWSRKFTPTGGDSKDFNVEYSSNAMATADKPVKQTFKYNEVKETEAEAETVKNLPYYAITYTAGPSNTPINDKTTFLSKIKYQKVSSEEVNVSIKSGYEFSFLPILMPNKQ